MDIPTFDLGRPAADLAEDLVDRWRRLLATTSFIGGPEVEAFEVAFADYLGVDGCVGVANGTDALVLALRALNAGPGDEVLVPAFTFVATAEAVAWVGATPVFVDVEPDTLNVAVDSAEAALSERTVGIIGVHLFGQPCDLGALGRLCREHELWLVEDAAQAHGARWQGRRVGGLGQLAAWSFYPSKNLGCFGDGGAVTGNDPELLARVRRLGNHGRLEAYRHAEVGTNSRLDALQAAVLSLRLATLDDDNARRRALARRYRQLLAGVGDVTFLAELPDTESVYHQLTIRSGRRDELRAFLGAEGIGSAVYYPVPLHRQPAFAHLSPPATGLPVSTVAAEEVLSLPMFPHLSEAAVERVGSAVRRFFGA